MIRPAREWLPRHYRLDPQSARQGLFDPALVPWLMADGGPIAAWDDAGVREIHAMVPVQSGKTVLVMGLLSHALAVAPRPAMLVLPAADEMETFLETRLFPVFESNPVGEMLPRKRYSKKRDRIDFPFGLLLGVGAQSRSKLSGKPIGLLVTDEGKDFEPGAYESAANRTAAFPDYRILDISSPDLVDKTIHARYLTGSQSVWHVVCRGCGEAFEPGWQTVAWDEGLERFDDRAKSLRVRCPHCGHEYGQDADSRRALRADGRWVVENEQRARKIYSCRWSPLIPPWAEWDRILRKVEDAQSAMKKGVTEVWRTVQTETLGIPWDVEQVDDPGDLKQGDYDKTDPWDAGTLRIMGVDVQRDRLEVVARAFAPDGSSRLLYEGTVRQWGDLAALQRDLDVQSRWVGVDCRFRRAETLRECHRHGWAAMEGDDRDRGYVHDRAPGKPRRPYAPPAAIEVGIGGTQRGLRCHLIAWSNRLVKDQLHLLSRGRAGNWTVARDASQEYREHMRAERLVTRHDAAGHPRHRWEMTNKRADNHRWDCECMVLTLAMLARVVDGMDEPTESD